jgi:hypothetical protein
MEATPNTHGTAKREGRRARRILADEGPSVASSENKRNGAAKNTDAQEDWLSLATADPSFWLRDVDF